MESTGAEPATHVQRLLRIDWDVIAGIIAAVTAMLLSFMGIAAEPCAAPKVGPSVPRYALRLLSHYDLIAQIEERTRHAVTSFRSDTEEAAENATAAPLPHFNRGGDGRPGSG